MKRDDRLRQLSSDHHHALALAVLATRVADGSAEGDPAAVHADALERFERELRPHFDVEERLLLPALREIGETELVERTLADHAAIRACIAEPPEADPRPWLARFGSLLNEHVRFEERELFEVAQEKLDDATLEAIAAASAETAVRPVDP